MRNFMSQEEVQECPKESLHYLFITLLLLLIHSGGIHRSRSRQVPRRRSVAVSLIIIGLVVVG